MRRVKVRIGGHLVHTMVGCKDVAYSYRYPYGCWEASFQILVGDGWRHPAFVEGALFEVLYGGSRPWLGLLNGINWESGEMTGMGMIRILERYRARYWDLDVDEFLPTWNPRTAIDAVISPNPLSGRPAAPIKRDNSVPDVDLAKREPDAEPLQLLELLDLATKRGYGAPSIGGDGVLRFLPEPTVRTWSVHPRVIDIGNAGGEDTATRIFVIYQFKTSLCWDETTTYPEGTVIWWDDQLWRKASAGGGGVKPVDGEGFWNPLGQASQWSAETQYEEGAFVISDGFDLGIGDSVGNVWEVTSGSPLVGDPPPAGGWTHRGQLPFDATTDAPDETVQPYREAPEVDARSLGPISTAEADEIAEAALAEALMPSYTSDIEVTPVTVTGQHGTPIVVLGHQAGELGRVNGVADPRLGQPFIDPVSAEYRVNGADSDYPTGLIKVEGKEARGYIEVMQAALEARRKKEWVG